MGLRYSKRDRKLGGDIVTRAGASAESRLSY